MLLHHRAHIPERARTSLEIRLARPNRVLNCRGQTPAVRVSGLPSGWSIKNRSTMYDALTGRFTFPCPARGETRVTLSAFRQLERLPGAEHPAVFQVLFACGCGEEHEGL